MGHPSKTESKIIFVFQNDNFDLADASFLQQLNLLMYFAESGFSTEIIASPNLKRRLSMDQSLRISELNLVWHDSPDNNEGQAGASEKQESRWAEIIQKINPLLVILHGRVSMVEGAILACRKHGVPSFLNPGEIILEDDPKSGLFKDNLEILNCVDGIFSNSLMTSKIMLDGGIDEKKILLLPLTINRKEIKKTARKKSFFVINQHFNLGFSGELEPEENLEEVIHAIHKIKEGDPKIKIRLLLEGDGSHRGTLEKLTKELSLKKTILFLGKRSGPKLSSFYRKVDVILSNRKKREFNYNPNPKLVEAISHGKPVIATNLSINLGYIRNGKNGLITDKEGQESIHESILSFIQDKGLASRLSENTTVMANGELSTDFHMEKLMPKIVIIAMIKYGGATPLSFDPMKEILTMEIKNNASANALCSTLLELSSEYEDSRGASNAVTCIIREFGSFAPEIIIENLVSGLLSQNYLDYRNIRDLCTIFNRCTEEDLDRLSKSIDQSTTKQQWALAGLSMRKNTSKNKLNRLFRTNKLTCTPKWTFKHDFEFYSMTKLMRKVSSKKPSNYLKQKLSKFGLSEEGNKKQLIARLDDFLTSGVYLDYPKIQDFDYLDRISLIPKNMKIDLGSDLIKSLFPLVDIGGGGGRSKNINNFEDLNSYSSIMKKLFSSFKDSIGPMKSIAIEAGYIYYLLNPNDDKFNIVYSRRARESGLTDLSLEIQSEILQNGENQELLNIHLTHFADYQKNHDIPTKSLPLEKYNIVGNLEYWIKKINSMSEFNKLLQADKIRHEINLMEGSFQFRYDINRDKSKVNQKLWLEITGHCRVDDDAKPSSGLITFDFLDYDYFLLNPFQISGLSHSAKVGWFSYFHQDNVTGKFRINFEVPKECDKIRMKMATWHKPKSLSIHPEIVFKQTYVKQSSDDESLVRSRIINEKLNGKWLKTLQDFDLEINSESEKKGMVYVTHMALPFENNGYCTRTHGLISNLTQYDPKITVESRFGYPRDKIRLRISKEEEIKNEYRIDGVTYRFDPEEYSGFNEVDEYGYILQASSRLARRISDDPPSFIQAASNHVNGAIGMVVARALKIPFIYEVRGLWHLSRLSRDPEYSQHKHFKSEDAAEISLCKEADMVLAITHAVRHYLV